MIPILYSPFETAFTSNGIGRLAECISCTVTEERNGIFECEFEYPINGKFYERLLEQNNLIIGVIHDDSKDVQPFEIYRHSDPINGIVTFNAHHISYRLGNVVVDPFIASTCAEALQGLSDNSITRNDFTFWTDKPTSGDFKLTTPDNVRALLCGKEGSILDVYGSGEYEFDKYDVKLYAHRGLNRGVTIRYGKNLADINHTFDASGIFNAVVPFWTDNKGTLVMLPEKAIYDVAGALFKYPWEETINGEIITDENGNEIEFQPFNIVATQLDFSEKFEEPPTVEELRTATEAYLTNNEPWIPHDNIEVDFVQLWQTPEYENVAALQRVQLCDTVAVYYPEMGIVNASAKVIKVVYNVLTEQYDRMELGEARATLAETISQPLQAELGKLAQESASFTEAAIARATEMITGGLGGFVVMNLNADGEPQEILIMDTDDINTAINVIRMNKNGIGFSHNGYEGPFTSAWTIDGHFNADFITAGTMLANRIYGGTLTVGGLSNQSGVLVVKDAYNEDVGRWDNSGIRFPISEDYSDYGGFDKNGFELNLHDKGRLYSHYYYTSAGSGSSDADAYLPSEGAEYFGLEGEYNEVNTQWLIDITPIDFLIGRYEGNGSGYDAKQFMHYDPGNGFEVRDDDQNRSLSYNPITYDILSTTGSIECQGKMTARGRVYAYGGLYTEGTKTRVVDTEEYSTRMLYCYETPSPMFADVGEGVIDESGFCYVFLEPVFAETISTEQYQVFLQKYGQGDCWVADRKGGYFVVQGTAGLSFGWELKAKQRDFDQYRLEKFEIEEHKETTTDYGKLASDFLRELEEGRIAS